MAANAAWWHDRVGKTIVWAHDAHIAKNTMLPKIYPDGMTGTFLRIPPGTERELHEGDAVRLGREVLRVEMS